MYIAHINNNQERQTVKEHCENTALICKNLAIDELKDIAYNIGLFHDIGKYQKSFQKRILGDNIKVEHSICGAIALDQNENFSKELKLILQYCIAGHHSGIPNGGTRTDTLDMSTLNGRLKRNLENFEQYKNELNLLPMLKDKFKQYLLSNCDNKDVLIEKYAFLVRYLFSCLVDADTIDTANFCENINYTNLSSNFYNCLNKINNKLNNFDNITELQKTRSKLQQQVYDKVNMDSNIYVMNMPTR